MFTNKVQYDEKYDETDDDYDEEVIVSAQGDCRIPVYESIISKEPIINCIGQLIMVYKYDDITRGYSIKTSGTGTVYHIDKHNKAYIITCAHNIRHRIKECVKCGKWMEKANTICIRCNCVQLKMSIIKANSIQFNRRNIENDYWTEENGKKIKVEYGKMEKAYKVQCFYINDDKYNEYPFTNQGYDIAILSFIDSDDYYTQYCKHICIENGKQVMDENINSFFMFGYPAYPKNAAKDGKMQGMESTGNSFQVKIAKKTNEFYLKQQVIDASKGQSGSAVFYVSKTNEKVVIFAVHTGGNQNNKYNVATLINDTILQKMQHEQQAMNRLNSFENKINSLINDMQIRKTHINETKKKYTDDINCAFDNVIKKINAKRDEILQELNQIVSNVEIIANEQSTKINMNKQTCDKIMNECKEIRNSEMNENEKQKEITAMINNEIKDETIVDKIDNLPHVQFYFDHEAVITFTSNLAEIHTPYPIPIIDNISCENITSTDCTVRWNATVVGGDLNSKTKTKLFMQLKTIDDSKEKEPIKSQMILFEANINKYEYVFNGLKNGTQYQMKMVFLEINEVIKKYENKLIQREDFENETIFKFQTYNFYGKGYFGYEDNGMASILRNGICYQLGTDFGRNGWRNPGKKGLIKLNSSGWAVGSINDFVGITSSASYAKDVNNSFISIDFGPNLRIQPTTYTLRHFSTEDAYFLRNWMLCGSNDGTNWDPIKIHENDKSFIAKGQTHSFQIIYISESSPYYRYFKIQMIGKNSGKGWSIGSSDWCICTTGFEIYGYLSGLQ
eukprot:417548_1